MVFSGSHDALPLWRPRGCLYPGVCIFGLVGAGMHLCGATKGGALDRVWKLLFVRYGMVHTASHSAGERGGVPVICCRPLAVNVSFARHRRICVRLGELGLGLITGHPIGCRSGPVK